MDFLLNMEPRIIETMSADFSKDFMEDEISRALKQMHPTKAPDPNGMPPPFFQCHCHIIGPSTSKALLSTLNLSQIPNVLNHTFITLIPKKKQPQIVADYHSISHCNVFYKLSSKVISNRLRAFLPLVIFDSQSTFVPERQITNNILVTYEVIHFLKEKTKSKQDFMSLKLDISKVYNHMKWGYLECTLVVLGFPNWIII